MEKNIKNILFINFGGLGDEILFLPSIISVKQAYPDAKISLALEPRSKGVIQLTDIIDETLFADIKGGRYKKYTELLKLLFIIWTKKYDVVVSSGANKFIALFLLLTMIPNRIGYNSGKFSECVLTNAVKLNKNQYAAKMYHDLVRNITKINTELPQINIEKRTKEANTILIHPGVSKLSIKKGMIKTVSPKIWAEVVDKLANSGKKVILAGGPDDSEVIEEIQNNVSSEKYINYYGKTKNLRELAELISENEKFLCSDSAPLHIAVALGVRTYAIFGSTDDKKLIPNNGLVTAVKTKCSCPLQPCLWEKRQTTCETPDCLNFTADEIVKEVLK